MSAKKYVRFDGGLWEDGYVAIPKKVLFDTELDVTTRVVYGYLCDLARDKDRAWPGQRLVAGQIGVSERKVRDSVRKLEAAGLLQTRQRGLGRTNLYTLTEPGSQTGTKEPEQGQILPPEQQSPPVPMEEDVDEQETDGRSSTPSFAGGSDVGVECDRIWAVYGELFPRTQAAGLTASRRRMLERGLKEGFTADQLIQAVRGLHKWRQRKPGDTSLSAIFKTRPGGSSFADQIEWWMSQAPTSVGGSVHIPSADRAKVAQRQQDVQRGHRLGHDPGAVRKAREAEAWLLKCGIATDRSGEGGYPTFRAATPDELATLTAAGGDS